MSLRVQAAAAAKHKTKGPEPVLLSLLRTADDTTRADVIDCINGHTAGEYDATCAASVITEALGTKITPDQVRRWVNRDQCPEEWMT